MKLWISVGVALPPKAKKSRTLVWWTGVEVVYFKQLFCLQIVCCSTNTTKYSCKAYKCKNINPFIRFQNSIEEGMIGTKLSKNILLSYYIHDQLKGYKTEKQDKNQKTFLQPTKYTFSYERKKHPLCNQSTVFLHNLFLIAFALVLCVCGPPNTTYKLKTCFHFNLGIWAVVGKMQFKCFSYHNSKAENWCLCV